MELRPITKNEQLFESRYKGLLREVYKGPNRDLEVQIMCGLAMSSAMAGHPLGSIELVSCYGDNPVLELVCASLEIPPTSEAIRDFLASGEIAVPSESLGIRIDRMILDGF